MRKPPSVFGPGGPAINPAICTPSTKRVAHRHGDCSAATSAAFSTTAQDHDRFGRVACSAGGRACERMPCCRRQRRCPAPTCWWTRPATAGLALWPYARGARCAHRDAFFDRRSDASCGALARGRCTSACTALRKRGTRHYLPLALPNRRDSSEGAASASPSRSTTWDGCGSCISGVPTPSITSQEYALEQTAQSQPEHEPAEVMS